MKKFYYVTTNGYDMVVSVENEVARYLTENEDFPHNVWGENGKARAIDFLKSIEDDSSWKDDLTFSELISGEETEVIVSIYEKETYAYEQ